MNALLFSHHVYLIQVTTAPGFHLFPFRTEKLSPVTPMVLRNSGRVGSRRFSEEASVSDKDTEALFVYIPPELLPLIPVMRCCRRIFCFFCHSFVIITEQSWCKTSFFWKSKNFSSFLSIQYQMDFCKFGVNLIGREKITQLIL